MDRSMNFLNQSLAPNRTFMDPYRKLMDPNWELMDPKIILNQVRNMWIKIYKNIEINLK